MPDVNACLEHCKFLISKGRGAEAAVLYLPRLEAQKRRANKEKRHRVVFECDEQIYSDFHEQRSRYIEACDGHVPIAHAIMVRCLAQLSSNLITKLSKDEPEQPSTEGLESA